MGTDTSLTHIGHVGTCFARLKLQCIEVIFKKLQEHVTHQLVSSNCHRKVLATLKHLIILLIIETNTIAKITTQTNAAASITK